MSDLADFFVTGGTLRPQAPSYVTRPADQELFDHVLAGDFCYVLTARQMGKSSLMVRTTRRLKEAGVATATIDLTGIGDTQADTWYISLLTRVKKGLQLSIDVAIWWRERADLGAPQRFTEFLRDIALEECAGPIAIFVDEIDSTLSLNFRDDFFAAIRAIYNARASDPAYSRLTFVLLGVATPTDLISDRQRTPFNIGRRIALQEFDATDARPLQQGLEAIHPGQSGTILARIFYWTNGHPYLTQKLCSAAAQADRAEWVDRDVDALVETSFFTKEARKESNLQFVQDRIRSTPPEERRRMLKLYRQLYAAKTIPDDDRSPIQNHLELSGLIGVAAGKLRIRNRIYQRVFDQNWITDNTPANTQLRIIVAASLFTLLLVAFIVYRTLNPVTQTTAEASVCIENFKKNTAVPARREALACLFDRPEYAETALRLFYNEMDAYDQKSLFLSSIPGISTNTQLDRQTVKVIKGVYTTLDDEMSNDLDIMGAMLGMLNASQQPEAGDLKTLIRYWQDGRIKAENGRYQEAIDRYTLAINVNNKNEDRNIGAHYDRAVALIKSQKYAQALEDLNQMIAIARTAPPTSTLTPTSILTPTSVLTVTGAPSAPSAVGTLNETVLSITAVPTITATSFLTPTPPTGASTSRFISTMLIIKTVDDTIRGSEGLLSYLRDPQNQTTANQDLVAVLGLSSAVLGSIPTVTPVPPAVTVNSFTIPVGQPFVVGVRNLDPDEPLQIWLTLPDNIPDNAIDNKAEKIEKPNKARSDGTATLEIKTDGRPVGDYSVVIDRGDTKAQIVIRFSIFVPRTPTLVPSPTSIFFPQSPLATSTPPPRPLGATVTLPPTATVTPSPQSQGVTVTLLPTATVTPSPQSQGATVTLLPTATPIVVVINERVIPVGQQFRIQVQNLDADEPIKIWLNRPGQTTEEIAKPTKARSDGTMTIVVETGGRPLGEYSVVIRRVNSLAQIVVPFAIFEPPTPTPMPIPTPTVF